jgi:hypothetical protein
MGPRQEELLSYLQGLAPVGETFEAPIVWPLHDLGFRNRSAVRNLIGKLIAQRCIRRIATSARNYSTGSMGVLMVLKRVEGLR